MARVFTIWLMLIYAFSATGATVHLHYCCGKLQHLAMEDKGNPGHGECALCLNHHENKKHAGCGDSESCDANPQLHDHCQDIQVDAKKTTGDHLASSDKNLLKIQSLELLVFTLIRVTDLPLDIHHTGETTDAPPSIGDIPLFVQHCTYRI